MFLSIGLVLAQPAFLQALCGAHRFPGDIGIIVHEHEIDVGKRDEVAGIQHTTADLPAIDEGTAGRILVVEDIFIILVNDLGVEAGEKFLVENNIVFQLTSQGNHRLRERNNLLIDDQKNP